LVHAYFGQDFELPDFGDRVVKISAEKWWLKKFIQFQYGELNPSNRVHQAVISRLPKEGPCKGLISPILGAKDKDKEKDSSLGGSRGKELFDLWNSIITAPLQMVRGISDARKKAAAARLKERPIDEWKQIIQRANRSSFCRGDNERGWTANIDWLLRPDTAIKIIEGKYDDRTNGAKDGHHPSECV
jgi:hypothetical protein